MADIVLQQIKLKILDYWICNSLESSGHRYMADIVQHIVYWNRTVILLNRYLAGTMPGSSATNFGHVQCLQVSFDVILIKISAWIFSFVWESINTGSCYSFLSQRKLMGFSCSCLHVWTHHICMHCISRIILL